jgi:hypothetical protein
MNTQIAAIAKYFGVTEYTIDNYCGLIGDLRVKLARYEDSVVVFKYSQKLNPFKKQVAEHQEAILNTLDGLFAFNKKTFLQQYSITHYIAVDKKNDDKVSFYTTYTKNNRGHFPLDIKVFGKNEFYEVNFTIVSCDDEFYITGFGDKRIDNLKEYFLLKNCQYDIKRMFGEEEFNKDLIDMCFI